MMKKEFAAWPSHAAQSSPKPAPRCCRPGEALAAAGSPRVLKKYPNRRLYDTQRQQLHHAWPMSRPWCCRPSERFEVRDAKTSRRPHAKHPACRSFWKKRGGGVPLFSASMLSQIDPLLRPLRSQGMMGSFLEKNLQTFTDIQARLDRSIDRLVRKPGRGAESRAVGAVPERPGAGDAGADGQLSRAVAQGLQRRCRNRSRSRHGRVVSGDARPGAGRQASHRAGQALKRRQCRR